MLFRERTRENFFDFLGKNEIEIADAFDAVRDEVDDDFVPDVEPFRMMVHGFGDEGDASHVAESGDEVLALVLAVKFAVLDFPAGQFRHEFRDFVVGKFSCVHSAPPEWMGFLHYGTQGGVPQ